MPVKIEISGDNAAQAYRELCDFTHLSSVGGQAAPATVATAEVPKQTRTRNTTKPVTAEPEKTAAAEPGGQADDGPVGGNAASDEPIPTDVELRAAAQNAAKSNGSAAVRALMESYGVKNISAIPDDQRTAFKRDLEAI